MTDLEKDRAGSELTFADSAAKQRTVASVFIAASIAPRCDWRERQYALHLDDSKEKMTGGITSSFDDVINDNVRINYIYLLMVLHSLFPKKQKDTQKRVVESYNRVYKGGK